MSDRVSIRVKAEYPHTSARVGGMIFTKLQAIDLPATGLGDEVLKSEILDVHPYEQVQPHEQATPTPAETPAAKTPPQPAETPSAPADAASTPASDGAASKKSKRGKDA